MTISELYRKDYEKAEAKTRAMIDKHFRKVIGVEPDLIETSFPFSLTFMVQTLDQDFTGMLTPSAAAIKKGSVHEQR